MDSGSWSIPPFDLIDDALLLPPPHDILHFPLGFDNQASGNTSAPSEQSDEFPDHSLLADASKVSEGPNTTPDVKAFNISGVSGEHAWFASFSMPWTDTDFSYSAPQLFDDGVDEARFDEVATMLLDEVVKELEDEDDDCILVFLACDIGGTILKRALHQAANSEKPEYLQILDKTPLLIFFATPHRASLTYPWQSTLFRLLHRSYPGRIDAWTPQQIDKLAALHESVAADFEKLDGRFRIYSYYQDNPIDNEYELIIPHHAATLGWKGETQVAAHRHHSLVGDFYVPHDQLIIQRLIEDTSIARRQDYNAWLRVLTKESGNVVPLENSEPVFKNLCEWMLSSSQPLKKWAYDTQKPATAEADAKPDSPTPERQESFISRNLHVLSIDAGSGSRDYCNLHSSFISVIESKQQPSGGRRDLFLSLSGFSASQEPITRAQLIASLCEQLLRVRASLVNSLTSLFKDLDAVNETSNTSLQESFLWKCLKTLLWAHSLPGTWILVYVPSDSKLSEPFIQLYGDLLTWMKTSELLARFVFIRCVNESSTIPGSQSIVNLDDANAIRCLQMDCLAQLESIALPQSLRRFVHSWPAIGSPQLSSHPLDSPLLLKLAERRVLQVDSSADPVILVLNSIPTPQRELVKEGLRWLIYGARPLTTREFGTALAGVTAGQKPFAEGETAADQFIHHLLGLVETRADKVCIAHPRLVTYVTETNSETSQWYCIPSPEANRRLANICMRRMRYLKTRVSTSRNLSASSSPETARPDTPMRERDPLLSYAIDNWYTHVSRCGTHSLSNQSSESSPEETREFDYWLHVRLSIARPAEQRRDGTQDTRSGPHESIWDPRVLSDQLKLPLDDCLQVVLAGKVLQSSADQSARSAIALAAVQIGKDKISSQMLSIPDVADAETLKAMFRTGRESLLQETLRKQEQFAAENLELLLLDAVRRGHGKLLEDLLTMFHGNALLESEETKNLLLDTCATSGCLQLETTDRLWTMLQPLEKEQPKNHSGNTPLHSAAISGHTSLVRMLISGGIDVNQLNDSGETALWLACKYGQYAIVHALLDAGADCRPPNARKSTPLHAACLRGYIDIVRMLLKHSMPIFDLNAESKTPLHVAIEQAYFDVAMTLLGTLDSSANQFPELNLESSQGSTPLILAVDGNNLPLVRLLLDCGVDIDIKDDSGRTAMHHAVKYGYHDIFAELLTRNGKAYGDDPAQITPLDSAATRGQMRILKTLLQQRPPSLEEHAEAIKSGLLLACRWGQTEVVRILFPYYTDKKPSDLAFWAVKGGWTETVCLLLDYGADKNAEDEDEETLLHKAAKENFSGLARALLLRGADVNVKDSAEQTPLVVAAAENSSSIVKMLLEAGADIDAATSGGDTALYAAAFGGHVQSMRLLLAAGASEGVPARYVDSCKSFIDFALLRGTMEIFSTVILHAKERGPVAISPVALCQFIEEMTDENDGIARIETLLGLGLDIDMDIGELGGLLHYAAAWGRPELLKFLLQPRAEVKVDINKINERNGTPLQLAADMCRHETLEVVDLLLSEGASLRLGGGRFGSPLHAAANVPYHIGSEQPISKISKSIDVVRRLLEHDEGAIHMVAGWHGTALHAAAHGGFVRMAKLLLEKGLGRDDLETLSGKHGTPLHAAVFEGNVDMMELLLAETKLQLTIETQDQEGRLPLHIAAVHRDTQSFQRLCKDGELIRRKDFQGRTALHLAAGNGADGVIEFILERDPELVHETDEDGWTALHWACRQENSSIIRRLLEKEARIMDLTHRGWLPRDVAVWHDSDVSLVEIDEEHIPEARSVTESSDDIETDQRVTVAGEKAAWITPSGIRSTNVTCDSCEGDIWGPKYTCNTCWDIDYCFKCFRHIRLYHYKNHKFTKSDSTPLELEIIDPWAA